MMNLQNIFKIFGFLLLPLILIVITLTVFFIPSFVYCYLISNCDFHLHIIVNYSIFGFLFYGLLLMISAIGLILIIFIIGISTIIIEFYIPNYCKNKKEKTL